MTFYRDDRHWPTQEGWGMRNDDMGTILSELRSIKEQSSTITTAIGRVEAGM